MKKRSAASTEVGENYRRARLLCEQLDDEEQRFPVLWGQWYHNMLRFEVREACALADELLVAGQSIGQESLEIEAHHCQWASRFLMGDPVRSLKHADEGLRLYRPEHHHPLMFVYGGHDPGVCAYDVGALTLWLTGQSTRARQRMDAALRLARKLGQSSTLANTLSKALTLAGFRCDLDAMADLGAQLLELTQGESAEQSRPHALAALAWVDFKRGCRELGLSRMREAVCSGLLEDPWNIYLVSMIAMAFAHESAIHEALELVDESLLLSRQNHVHWWEPELFRVKGEVLARAPQRDPAEARCWLERACEAARSQGATGLELRAAWSLARLRDAWAGELEVQENPGNRLMSLEKGFTAADLGEARAALQRLS